MRRRIELTIVVLLGAIVAFAVLVVKIPLPEFLENDDEVHGKASTKCAGVSDGRGVADAGSTEPGNELLSLPTGAQPAAGSSNGAPTGVAESVETEQLVCGDPERIRPPAIAAWGEDNQHRVLAARIEDAERRQGLMVNDDTVFATRTCCVSGRVYELRGGLRIPLSGVVVYDAPRMHRTITSEDGYFSFDAFLSPYERATGKAVEGGESRPVKSYTVKLMAQALGYEMVDATPLGKTFLEEQVKAPEGVELYLQASENELIDVWIKNAELAEGEITVSLSAAPELFEMGKIYDERMFVSTTISREGHAWFSVPPGAFTLSGVSGAGIRVADARKKVSGPSLPVTWEVMLERCLTFYCSGKICDLRSSDPICGSVVRGGEAYERTFSAEDGSFGLWIAERPRDLNGEANAVQRLSCDALGYLAATASTGKGNEAQHLQIQMRPLVRVSGELVLPGYQAHESDRISSSVVAGPSWFGTSTVPIRDGVFECEFFPWGVCDLRAEFYGSGGRQIVALGVPEECWRGSAPYVIRASAK